MEISPEQQPRQQRHAILKLAVIGLSTASLTGYLSTAEARQTCGDTVQAIAPYEYQDILPEIGESTVLDPALREAFLDEIGHHFTTPIVFDVPPSAETAKDDTATLNGIVRGLEQLTPVLVNALDVKEIRIKQEIINNGTPAGGTYSFADNAIAIQHSSRPTAERTTVHELQHAIDGVLLCPESDRNVDIALSKYSDDTQLSPQSIAQEYYQPTESRLFSNAYGSSSPVEDRATQVEYLFYDRGIVQPQDPDYGAPFRTKQREILRRLEMLTPGITAYLQDRTPSLRVKSSELEDAIEHPYKPGEFGSPLSILSHAFLNNIPVEQLRGTTAYITLPNHRPQAIENPVIVRDADGIVKAIAWNDVQSKGFAVTTMYYDEHSIIFNSDPNAYSHFGLIESTAKDARGFLVEGLRIEGVTPAKVSLDLKKIQSIETLLAVLHP